MKCVVLCADRAGFTCLSSFDSVPHSRIHTLQTSRSAPGEKDGGWVWAVSPACRPPVWMWADYGSRMTSRQTESPVGQTGIEQSWFLQGKLLGYLILYPLWLTERCCNMKLNINNWSNTELFSQGLAKDKIMNVKLNVTCLVLCFNVI